MLYLAATVALAFSGNAVMPSSSRAAVMMNAPRPVFNGMGRNDLMGQQFTGFEGGHMSITEAGSETGLYGMVVPTTAPKPAEKNPLRPKYNGMGRNDMMGSATNNEEHMAITIVPVEGEVAAPAPTPAPAAAPKVKDLRPTFNGMGRNDMMGSNVDTFDHMAITIVPVE